MLNFVSAYPLDNAIRIAEPFGAEIQFIRQRSRLKLSFEIDKVFQLAEEPAVDGGNLMYFIHRYIPPQSLKHNEQPLIVTYMKLFNELCIRK